MPAPTDYAQMYRDLRRDVDALLRRSPLANTGMSATAEQELTVDGKLIVTGAAEIAGTLSLPAGIINNDALANPVRTDSSFGTATNFPVTTTGTTPLVSMSWLTPAGFTQCNILIASRVLAYNSTASLDWLYARPRAYLPSTGGIFQGNGIALAVSGSGGSGINPSFVSVEARELTDGEEIRLEVQGWTAVANWAADPNNYAEVSAQILWTR